MKNPLIISIIFIIEKFLISSSLLLHNKIPILRSNIFRNHWSLQLSTFESSLTEPTPNVSPLPFLQDRRPLKTAILALAARTKRGEIASKQEKELASELISKLESLNPIPHPCFSNDTVSCLGKWELIYTNTNVFRSSPFFMSVRAVCKEGKQADRFNMFCDLHREALAFTNMGKVIQIITEDSLTSEFETSVPLVPGLFFTVTGTIESNADIVDKTGDSWTLYMDKVRIKKDTSNIPIVNNLLNDFPGLPIRTLGSFLESTSSVTNYSNPRPVFRTRYLDTHMRISRDQDDNVFVYNRVV